jgi:hypothetical protein
VGWVRLWFPNWIRKVIGRLDEKVKQIKNVTAEKKYFEYIYIGQVQAAGLPTTRANTHVAEVFFQLAELSPVAGNFLDKVQPKPDLVLA